ncbi:hypothetical protein FHG87_007541 [Trinorchestia longiramus]|nr:hypothetical protein FHG87_007541 [Trinorchestia longiramus]
MKKKNDRNSYEDLEAFVQQCWSSSLTSSNPGGEAGEAAGWELHCEVLLALLYLQLCGSKMKSSRVEVHHCQFMIKWFGSCDGFLNTAAAVREHLWTQSFVGFVLLHVLLVPATATEVKAFIKAFRTRPHPSISPSPAWLQQILAVDDPYSSLLESLLRTLTFQHNLPQVPNDGNVSLDILTLLKIFNDYHRHETASVLDALEKIIHSESICDSVVLGYGFWLKGLVAQDKSCFTLATACYRNAVRSWPRLPFVFLNAYQAYRRSRVPTAALESLRLFVRSCAEEAGHDEHLPYSAAVLQLLLPPPCPVAARALLMVVSVHHKLYSEALEHFRILQDLPTWPSLPAGEDTSCRRLLLRHDHLPLTCPSMADLRMQAALAAAQLPRLPVLEEILASPEHDHVDGAEYYDSSCRHQVLLLSSLLRRILRAWRYLQLQQHGATMTECAGLVESMSWVLPAIPTGHNIPPLLALLPLLLRALVYLYLSRLHTVFSNENNARHFKRLMKQNIIFAMDFVSSTQVAPGSRNSSCLLGSMNVELDDETCEQDRVHGDAEAAFLKNKSVVLLREVSKFCEGVTENSRYEIDESNAFIVGNIIMFVLDALCTSTNEN